jgi:crotonobetainyl-CoA:carnitine CoA-transferase CaiB-like acyl-CoA transferase
VSLLAAALAVQVQDLVWLEGEQEAGARTATPTDLRARADEIAGGLAMNPYYRCYATTDGFIAVACLNLAQRRAFLSLFKLDDPTDHAPDVVPDDGTLLAAKRRLTSEIERRFSEEPTSPWLERLAAASVPASPVLMRESVRADAQVVASGLVTEIEQTGLGRVGLLGSLVGAGGEPEAAPLLGADTDAVLAELA